MNEWLLLSYKVPPEPSSKRVSIWRRIKGAGAIYIQNGVCMLPKNDEHQRQFKIIQNDIVNIGGETLLLETRGLDPKEEENIISRFNEERNDQYQEFLDKCKDNIAAGPASYGFTDTLGRMHSDAQFAGSSSVPAHVDMMGFIGMGNNPIVGACVALAVKAAQANRS